MSRFFNADKAPPASLEHAADGENFPAQARADFVRLRL
jgi:hypothetical protein